MRKLFAITLGIALALQVALSTTLLGSTPLGPQPVLAGEDIPTPEPGPGPKP